MNRKIRARDFLVRFIQSVERKEITRKIMENNELEFATRSSQLSHPKQIKEESNLCV